MMPPLRRESKRRPGRWPAEVIRLLAVGPRQTGRREWESIDEPLLREAWESLRDVITEAWRPGGFEDVHPFIAGTGVERVSLALRWDFNVSRSVEPWAAVRFDGASVWEPGDADAWRN